MQKLHQPNQTVMARFNRASSRDEGGILPHPKRSRSGVDKWGGWYGIHRFWNAESAESAERAESAE